MERKRTLLWIVGAMVLLAPGVFAQYLTFDQVWVDSLVGRRYNVRSVDFGQSDVLFAGTIGRGLWRSSDYGNTWAPVGGFVDPSVWDIAARRSSGLMLAASYSRGLYRSNDNGATGKMLTGNLGLTDSIEWGVSVLMVPSGDIFFGSAGYGIFKSTDGGNSWQEKNNGLVRSPLGYYYLTRSLTVNAHGELFVIVGNDGGYDSNRGIFKSTDGGEHWFRQYVGMDYGIPLKRIVVSPVNDYLMAVSGFLPPYGGIFRSTDRGASWERVFNGASSWWGLGVNQDGLFFAGARSDGVYRSNVQGLDWTLAGYPAVDVQAITFDLHGRVFLGTSDGVFRSRESTMGIDESGITTPLAFALEQNYPNPFNPLTNFQFSIASSNGGSASGGNSQLTTLKVFDILGREVATLVNEQKSLGTYTVQWDADGLASGMYFYRLQAGASVSTKKLSLLR